MRRNVTFLIAAALGGIACEPHRPAVVADDLPRALAEARRASDEVLLVELWARW